MRSNYALSTTPEAQIGISVYAQRRTQLASRVIASLLIVCCALGFSGLLVYVYATFTVTRYGYMGHEWNPNYTGFSSALLFVSIAAVFLPVKLARPGDIAVSFLFCFAFVPGMSLPPAVSGLGINSILPFQMVLLAGFLIVLAFNAAPQVNIQLDILTPRAYEVLLIVLSLVMVTPLVYYLGIPRTLPGFGDVYAIRLQNRLALVAAPGYVGYLLGLVAKVISPYLVAYGVASKRPLFVGLGVLFALYLYGVTGLKGLLFFLVLLVLVTVCVWLFGNRLVALVVPGALLVVLGARLVDLFLPQPWLSALLVDRTFIMPGVLTGYYHEFFTLNPPGEWAYSFLSWANTYPYDRSPAFLIGTEYFSNPANQANTHMWADGFANFRYVGVLLVSVIGGLLIWLLNSFALSKSMLLVAPLTAVAAMSLASDSVFTSLLTHGLALTIILMALSPGAAQYKKQRADDF